MNQVAATSSSRAERVLHLLSLEQTATRRGIARDAEALGGEEAARAAYEQRYRAACAIYVEEERPRERASVILDPSGT